MMTANRDDYAPGPCDCLGSDLCGIWEAIWELVEQGLLEPTHNVVNSQRVFRPASDGQVRRRERPRGSRRHVRRHRQRRRCDGTRR